MACGCMKGRKSLGAWKPKLIKCRFPSGHFNLAQDYFEAHLEAKAGHGSKRRLDLLLAEMTPAEHKIVDRALTCYRHGGMVLWDRK